MSVEREEIRPRPLARIDEMDQYKKNDYTEGAIGIGPINTAEFSARIQPPSSPDAAESPQGTLLLGSPAFTSLSRCAYQTIRRQTEQRRQTLEDKQALGEAEYKMLQVRDHALATIGTRGGGTVQDVEEAERLLQAIRHHQGILARTDAASTVSLRSFPLPVLGSPQVSPKPIATPRALLLRQSSPSPAVMPSGNTGSLAFHQADDDIEGRDQIEPWRSRGKGKQRAT
ncbi:hypothetical protein KC332_g4097 [Hortaea werneckii]|nr:hypothetical protein KC358_g7905 [Hortaea werneckii]KAI6838319.1 hypothetical protein KC350_g5865 [Hortaea werneckii]KAI6934033.1 hypothetical protein KC341_g7858 [Hortaea werneckii]KAI6941330.1 hypothetical protein KC348_g4733 [Hortaea werneckii]KAI6970884.1 hypothetical protein KC321_g7075 [Hortaea werneckii]